MRRRVCRRVGLSNRYTGCRSGGCAVRRALYPAHNGGYDHNGIDVGDKAHQHYGIFGDPGVWRDVAVANGQNGDVAEIEKIVDGVFACAESIEGAGGGKFDGQKEIESAIGDEHEAADGREYHACADHVRVGYLPENLQGNAAEKADVQQQHFGQQAAGKKEIQRSADHQQHAKKHHKPDDALLEFKKHQASQQLKGQVDGLGHAAIDIVGKKDIENKDAQKGCHQQLKTVNVEL